jgi:hypothetical protein
VQWAFALSLVSSAAGACVGAVAEGGAQPPSAQPRGGGDEWITSQAAAAGGDAGADVQCPHGALEDPHRGFVRCLEPGEADAGWLPPAPQPEPPADAGDAGTDAAPAPPPRAGGSDGGVDAQPPIAPPPVAPAVPGPPPRIELKEPEFMNGEVPNVNKRLEKVTGDIARCVADNGGLTGASGNIKLQFLVRMQGRAEGVEILSARGVSPEAQRCVRLLLKNKSVGTPTVDPVGVTVTLSLKASK